MTKAHPITEIGTRDVYIVQRGHRFWQGHMVRLTTDIGDLQAGTIAIFTAHGNGRGGYVYNLKEHGGSKTACWQPLTRDELTAKAKKDQRAYELASARAALKHVPVQRYVPGRGFVSVE